MKKASLMKLAVAMFLGLMMPVLASCGDDDKKSDRFDTTPAGAKAQYYVEVDPTTFEGFTVEVEYTDNSGRMAKQALTSSNNVFEKGVVVNSLPITIEMNVVATPKDNSSLTKDKYDCLFTYGLGAAPVNANGEVVGNVSVSPEFNLSSGISVERMKTITRSKSVVFDKNGNITR